MRGQSHPPKHLSAGAPPSGGAFLLRGVLLLSPSSTTGKETAERLSLFLWWNLRGILRRRSRLRDTSDFSAKPWGRRRRPHLAPQGKILVFERAFSPVPQLHHEKTARWGGFFVVELRGIGCVFASGKNKGCPAGDGGARQSPGLSHWDVRSPAAKQKTTPMGWFFVWWTLGGSNP